MRLSQAPGLHVSGAFLWPEKASRVRLKQDGCGKGEGKRGTLVMQPLLWAKNVVRQEASITLYKQYDSFTKVS